jgi:hypothetical protein
LVYKINAAPFFGGDFNLITRNVSHDPSRKSFLGKLAGFAAMASLAPRVFAKSAAAAGPVEKPAPGLPFTLAPDPRAVSRRDGSV